MNLPYLLSRGLSGSRRKVLFVRRIKSNTLLRGENVSKRDQFARHSAFSSFSIRMMSSCSS